MEQGGISRVTGLHLCYQIQIKMKNLKDQIAHFTEQGVAISKEGDSACHNFWDWFCKDTSLQAKSVKLMRAVKAFVKANPNLDLEKHYVFFKNNCPLNGPLYDSFSICETESGNVVYWVTPKSGHSGQAEIISRAIGFETPMSIGKNLTEALKLAKF